jgi:hypothetical protein
MTDLPTILRWIPDPADPNTHHLSDGSASIRREGYVCHWRAGDESGETDHISDAEESVYDRLPPGTWVEDFHSKCIRRADNEAQIYRNSYTPEEWGWSAYGTACIVGLDTPIDISAGGLVPTQDDALAMAIRVNAAMAGGAA